MKLLQETETSPFVHDTAPDLTWMSENLHQLAAHMLLKVIRNAHAAELCILLLHGGNTQQQEQPIRVIYFLEGICLLRH